MKFFFLFIFLMAIFEFGLTALLLISIQYGPLAFVGILSVGIAFWYSRVKRLRSVGILNDWLPESRREAALARVHSDFQKEET